MAVKNSSIDFAFSIIDSKDLTSSLAGAAVEV